MAEGDRDNGGRPPRCLVVDALFGTGLNKEIRGGLVDVISFLNKSDSPVCSVDIPSGISADSGRVMGEAVKADLTITFYKSKKGLEKAKKFLYVKKPVRVEDGDRYAQLDPGPEFRVDFVISYDRPMLSYQRREFRFLGQDFEREISPARTYGFLNEVEQLRKLGLAKGGGLENVVVISDDGVVNPEDSFVRTSRYAIRFLIAWET
jgi:UDP-3-O-[3-hydroxymyristoyl] N-acetylglucosamine deacetylase